MRKTSDSSNSLASRAFSSWADSRSWPNGFSITRRFQPLFARRLPISSTSVPITAGGTAK